MRTNVRIRVLAAAAALLAASGNLSAQDPPALQPSGDSVRLELAQPVVPSALVPSGPQAVHSTKIAGLQDDSRTVPVLFGIVGGIAGIFVADWWADRNCADTCGYPNLPALFVGGVAGAMLGWLIGGGGIPDPGL